MDGLTDGYTDGWIGLVGEFGWDMLGHAGTWWERRIYWGCRVIA
jgi:hypothetical protein